MLNFLTLILYLEFKKALKGKYTVEGALAELTNLMCVIYDHETLVMEPTKKMKEVFSLLDLTEPNSLGVYAQSGFKERNRRIHRKDPTIAG